MKCAVVVFPGSNCETDCFHILKDVLHQDVFYVWHKEASFPSCDLVILPGGFSYGDYLRCGAIARFSPVMKEVTHHAKLGRLVLGICNGFQILVEAGLLPGALLRNASLSFVCRHVYVRVETARSAFTQRAAVGDVLEIPVAHGEGNYFCEADMLKRLQEEDRIAFRYVTPEGHDDARANPNGSLSNIAGIINRERNVLGMMPHPERASESVLGSTQGRVVWDSLLTGSGAG